MKKISLLLVALFVLCFNAFAQKYDELDLRKVVFKVDSLLENKAYSWFAGSNEYLIESRKDSIEEKKLISMFTKISDDANAGGVVVVSIEYYTNTHGYGRTAYFVNAYLFDGGGSTAWRAYIDILSSDAQFVKDSSIQQSIEYLHKTPNKDFDGYLYFTKDGKRVSPSDIKFY